MDISNIKDEYTRKMHSKLDQWNNKIDALVAKADQAEEQINTEYRQQIKILHNKRDEVHKKLSELEQSSEKAWEDMKVGVEMVPLWF